MPNKKGEKESKKRGRPDKELYDPHSFLSIKERLYANENNIQTYREKVDLFESQNTELMKGLSKYEKKIEKMEKVVEDLSKKVIGIKKAVVIMKDEVFSDKCDFNNVSRRVTMIENSILSENNKIVRDTLTKIKKSDEHPT